MATAVSAGELASEVSANPRTFRYYLLKNWGDRQKYQRWLFTRAQADRIKATYLASVKYGTRRTISVAARDRRQLKMKFPVP